MIYQLQQFIKSTSKIYADVWINLLFIFCSCLTLDYTEKAFQYYSLFYVIIYLGYAIIPLSAWSVIYYLFFRNRIKFFTYEKSLDNLKIAFGIFCLTVTFISIGKDVYQVITGKAHFFPAGIIGQYLEFISPLNNGNLHQFSGWILAKYILLLVFSSAYSMTIVQWFKIKLSLLKIPDVNEEDKIPNKEKVTRKKGRIYRKKLHYIE